MKLVAKRSCKEADKSATVMPHEATDYDTLYRVAQNKVEHFSFIRRHVLSWWVSLHTAHCTDQRKMPVASGIFIADLWAPRRSSWLQIISPTTPTFSVIRTVCPTCLRHPVYFITQWRIQKIFCWNSAVSLPSKVLGKNRKQKCLWGQFRQTLLTVAHLLLAGSLLIFFSNY